MAPGLKGLKRLHRTIRKTTKILGYLVSCSNLGSQAEKFGDVGSEIIGGSPSQKTRNFLCSQVLVQAQDLAEGFIERPEGPQLDS